MVREVDDGLVCIVHSHPNSSFAFEGEDFSGDKLSVTGGRESELEFSRPRDLNILAFVLVAIGVSSDDKGQLPAWDESRDIFADDGFSEDGSVEDSPDSAVGGFPHFFQLELLNSLFVGSDGSALDSYFMFQDGVSGVDSDLVVGLVSVFDAQIVVLEVDVNVGQDEPVSDPLPDDPCHLVTVEFNDSILDLDFSSSPLDSSLKHRRRH